MDRRNFANPPNAGNNHGGHNRRNGGRNFNPNNNRFNNNPQVPNVNQNNNYRRPQRQDNRDGGNNRQPHNSRNNDQNKATFFYFNRLKELSEKESNEVMTTLDRNKVEFEKHLRDIKSPDMLVLTLRILTKVCQANFAEIVTSVISHACSASFIHNLETFLMKLPYDTDMDKIKNQFYYENKERFWSNLIEFFKKVIDLIPTKARDELTSLLKKINPIIMSIEAAQDYKIDEKVKCAMQDLSKQLEEEIRKIEEKNKAQVTRAVPNETDFEGEPPEDFRKLSIIPTIDDLFDDRPFYRACKIKDAYDSVEHYLDVQFRLLREDFISPLRSGIKEYLEGQQNYRNSDLRIYRKVNLIAPDVSKNNVGIVAYFGPIKGINWRRTKRFMHGGLLLLSSDNFKSMLFATVADRDERQLEKGCILIEPCEGTTITREMYNDTNFLMLESKIYFEPYLAVLNAMQFMGEQNFPMIPYLVNAAISTRLPTYLSRGTMLRYKQFNLPVGYEEHWPPARELKLDETQYNAFKCALTEEFAVIQGPPGTGKTFIALEIVRTLLENKVNWQQEGPIIVVCLTNHALDQFLEGILRYTQSIVRIGSRSKSETLKPYTLMERRKGSNVRRNKNAVGSMYETKRELESILSSIGKSRSIIKYLTTPDAIVPLDCLTEYCNHPELSEMKSNENLVNWLIGANVTPAVKNAAAQKQVNGAELVPEEIFEDPEDSRMDDDLDLDYETEVDKDTFKLAFPLESYDAKIANIQQEIHQFRQHAQMNAIPFDPAIPLVQNFNMLTQHLNILNQQRATLQRDLAQHPLLNKPRNQRPPPNYRWALYWDWVRNSYNLAMNEITRLERSYRQTRSKLNEVKQLVDLDILREHEIIGLTTTGAAKLHASLRALRAPIVLVEEAAEILEAHVVCSMSRHCKHVILIGDHKQLRPKASVYKLGTKYNLNISLFERMVNIRGNCTQLAYQHRMRPQIAKLITPSIYDKLYNHDSVLDYRNVKGVQKNLFFLNHNNRENNHNNEESFANEYEVKFITAFARHLLMQGYDAADITILCTYTGQLFALMKETGRYAVLKQVRTTTVDNYQGEENKIILLSLVRNNGVGKIGFLKEENRVCVALSRAREGMFVLGNMNDLLVNNTIWPKINKELEDENAIGDSLVLQCQIHPDQLTKIKDENDFQQCPEGGCLKRCNIELSCGHCCTSVCHILDREHKLYQCKQPCINSCPYDHPCPLKCWEGCKQCRVMVERKLKCGHTVQMLCSQNPDTFPCYIEVEDILPDCNHSTKKLCHVAIETCNCSLPCENRLPCGHMCRLKCHVTEDPDHIQYKCYKNCSKNNIDCENSHPCKKLCYEECGPCTIIVRKKRSCGHFYPKILCSKNVETVQCEKPCTRILNCAHNCPEKCWQDCGNCSVKVKKVSSCGHTIEVKCCEEAIPSKCKSRCQKILACGHPCTNRCKDSCITTCKTLVNQKKPGLCGHTFAIPCHLQGIESKSLELLQFCKEPCGTLLACNHLCGGNCGQCKQGRIHIPCNEDCGNILVCGHKCEVPCRLECQPCKRLCELKCRHSKCNKKCGMPCVSCKELCAWGCEHRKCEKRCFELCDIEPCNEPCPKKLKCEHPCVGFCGDPCPPLCRICDNEELTEIFFGEEDEPDARFVLLEDCSHCIESNGLSEWLTKSGGTIQMKTCPRCKTPIKKCMRIMNQIKKDLMDVILVKKKVFFGNHKDLEKKQIEYLEIFQSMSENSILTESPELKRLLSILWDKAIPVRKQKRQILSAQEIEAFRIVLDLLRQMFDILTLIKNHAVTSYLTVKNQIAIIIESFPAQWQISTQELNDIQLELRRLNYMVEICNLDAEYNIKASNAKIQKEYSVVVNNLMSIKRFTEQVETEVRKRINELFENFKKNIVIERQMIVKAMGFKQGHWFKCPNGHIYSIGECGGAMQESKCNECGAVIGGGSHRLRNDNALASEMDGARESAWPGTNNFPFY